MSTEQQPQTSTAAPTPQAPPSESSGLWSVLGSYWNQIKGRKLYMWVGGVTLLVAVIVVVVVLRRNAATAESQLWLELDLARSSGKEEELVKIEKSEKHKGKETRILARVYLARLRLYRDGLNQLATSDEAAQKAALAKIEEGRKLYLELTNELKDQPALLQEAWISAAKAEEVLSGVPSPSADGEYLGSIDKTIEYYKKAAAISPNSDVSKGYAKKAEEMAAKKDEIIVFYRDLYRFGTIPKINAPIPTP